MPKAKIGDLVEITWYDACGRTNEKLSKAIPPKAKNIGVLAVDKEEYIVLRTGFYLEEEDPECDTTVIPKGWKVKIKVLISNYEN